jgi:predicted transcriptional regulator YdeE
MNEDIENFYRLYIITYSLKTKLTRKSQVIIIQIWEPKRIGKTSEAELKKLANVFVDGHG